MSRYATATKQHVPHSARSVPALAGGRPLHAHTRAKMDARFGHDFSSVRIHADNAAACFAQSASAKALTLGSDILFGSGRYSPGRRDSERLLTHELAHVVQQERSGPGDPTHASRRDDPSEREAEKAEDLVTAGASIQIGAAPDAAIARDEKETCSTNDDDGSSFEQTMSWMNDKESYVANQPVFNNPYWNAATNNAVSGATSMGQEYLNPSDMNTADYMAAMEADRISWDDYAPSSPSSPAVSSTTAPATESDVNASYMAMEPNATPPTFEQSMNSSVSEELSGTGGRAPLEPYNAGEAPLNPSNYGTPALTTDAEIAQAGGNSVYEGGKIPSEVPGESFVEREWREANIRQNDGWPWLEDEDLFGKAPPPPTPASPPTPGDMVENASVPLPNESAEFPKAFSTPPERVPYPEWVQDRAVEEPILREQLGFDPEPAVKDNVRGPDTPAASYAESSASLAEPAESPVADSPGVGPAVSELTPDPRPIEDQISESMAPLSSESPASAELNPYDFPDGASIHTSRQAIKNSINEEVSGMDNPGSTPLNPDNFGDAAKVGTGVEEGVSTGSSILGKLGKGLGFANKFALNPLGFASNSVGMYQDIEQGNWGHAGLDALGAGSSGIGVAASLPGMAARLPTLGPAGAVIGAGVGGYAAGEQLTSFANSSAKVHGYFGESSDSSENRDASETAADWGTSVRDYLHSTWVPNFIGDAVGLQTTFDSSIATTLYGGVRGLGSSIYDLVNPGKTDMGDLNNMQAGMGENLDQIDAQENQSELEENMHFSSSAREELPPPLQEAQKK